MKTFLIAAAVTLLGGASQAFSCPNIAGSWIRSDGIVISMSQAGCNVRGTIPSVAFDHVLAASLGGSSGFGTINRTNMGTGCVTVMNIQLFTFGSNQIRVDVTGTDGRCDLTTSFRESSLYSRQ